MKNKIEHNGKLYDVGGGYLASGYMGLFSLIEKDVSGRARICHIGSDGGELLVKFSELISTEYTTGTITDAPKDIELEDGEWYLCNYTDDVGLGVNVPLFRLNEKWYRSVVEGAGACDRCDEDIEVIHKLSKQTVKPIGREEFVAEVRTWLDAEMRTWLGDVDWSTVENLYK